MELQDIFDTYTKFQKEYDSDFIYPKIYPMFKNLDNQINAQVEKVTERSAHLSINTDFIFNKTNKIYFESILYHEFVHIVDSLTYLKSERDANGYTFLEFPFNEFHASQIQFLKMLNIFSAEGKIFISSKVNMVNEIITVSQFVDECRFEIQKRYSALNKTSKLEDIIYFVSCIVYNIGYFSILKFHNIYENFWLDFKNVHYVQEDLHLLMDMLLNTLPSDQLCLDTHNITVKIIAKMLNYYEIERD